MTANAANIQGIHLITTLSDGRIWCIATASKRFDGTYRWFGSMRSGRSNYKTPTEALRAAAKTIGWKIEPAAPLPVVGQPYCQAQYEWPD